MILETFKSLRWVDFFLYALTDPRELYRRIKQKDPDPFALSFIVPLISALFDILILSLMGRESEFFYYKISYGWILVFIYGIFKIAVYSSLVDVTAQFFGYRGNIREIITLVNFSLFPGVLFLPVCYLFSVIKFCARFFLCVLFNCFFCMVCHDFCSGNFRDAFYRFREVICYIYTTGTFYRYNIFSYNGSACNYRFRIYNCIKRELFINLRQSVSEAPPAR